jgi:hypothetical protein
VKVTYICLFVPDRFSVPWAVMCQRRLYEGKIFRTLVQESKWSSDIKRPWSPPDPHGADFKLISKRGLYQSAAYPLLFLSMAYVSYSSCRDSEWLLAMSGQCAFKRNARSINDQAPSTSAATYLAHFSFSIRPLPLLQDTVLDSAHSPAKSRSTRNPGLDDETF